MTKKANVRSPRPRGWLSSGDGDSRRLAVQSIHAHRAARLDLGGLRFDEPHDMADHVGVLNMRSEEHTSELQSLMRISYAVFCLKKKQIRKRHELPLDEKHELKQQ